MTNQKYIIIAVSRTDVASIYGNGAGSLGWHPLQGRQIDDLTAFTGTSAEVCAIRDKTDSFQINKGHTFHIIKVQS